MSLEQKILQTLEHNPLSTDELLSKLGVSAHELNQALYQLGDQKMWVKKHPVFGDGCKTCACSITYSWRLTFSGRQELANQQGKQNV